MTLAKSQMNERVKSAHVGGSLFPTTTVFRSALRAAYVRSRVGDALGVDLSRVGRLGKKFSG